MTPQLAGIRRAYTYLDGKIVRSPEIGTGADAGIAAEGKRALNTPRHSATIWTTLRPAEHWEVGGGVLYSSGAHCSTTTRPRRSTATRGSTRRSPRLQRSYEVRLNLQNLTDELLFRRSAAAGRATPVRGRTALVTLLKRF